VFEQIAVSYRFCRWRAVDIAQTFDSNSRSSHLVGRDETEGHAMGCVQQAVLEFDEAVQAPWRPRLVSAPLPEVSGGRRVVRPMSPRPPSGRPSRVGACSPAAAQARPAVPSRSAAVAGTRPDEMGIGPVFAVPKLLKHTGKKLADIDVIELNEAFASQVVYCRDKLGLDPDRLNPNGGSISIGHPYGMTGSRCTGTILQELRRSKKRYGIVTMCIGGGMGAAGLFEAA